MVTRSMLLGLLQSAGQSEEQDLACFDGKLVKHPAEIVCYVCAFMRYWIGLYLAEIQEMMVERVSIKLHVAKRLLPESAFFGPGDAAAGGRTLKG